ncbi:glycosyltransferase family 4 protein [Agarilytica rhodophyticola]|uniref:glycosyltransferase family 4 protein n=1 Tax=Agarilytica rhodophyticola TaxID=1737490 RepID=UPI000B34584B|nr:glycosyltransferase family 4 protein [Agarilytica rhodophyticola]
MTAAEPKPSGPSIEASLANAFSSSLSRPLKIALLGYRSHPFVGGQGIYIKYLSRALSAMGHSVDVISGPPYPELDENIRLIKVPSLDLFAHPNHARALKARHLKSFTDTFEWWSMLTGGFAEPYTFGRRVEKLLRNSDYDIIHDNQSLCYGLVALQKRGLNVVSTIHHPIHRDRALALKAAKKWSDRLLIKRWHSFLNMQEVVVKKLHNIITVSSTSQKDIAKYFARPEADTPVISNGIDTETFKPYPSIETKPYRIITTASSDQPLKGLQFLLQAVHSLQEGFSNLELVVVGKLKEDGDTQKQLEALDINGRVKFKSNLSTQELVELYASSHIAVSPSLYEGFGLPVGEAMACQLPVIATDGGALPEVVGNAGYIVKAGDSQALARQLKFLFDNPDQAQAMAIKARQHIISNFSWAKVAQTLTQYYAGIMTRADH